MPDAVTTQVQLPRSATGVFWVRKKHPEDHTYYRGMSFVVLDQYTSEVLRIKSAIAPLPADSILNAFIPLHYGTFWGLPTRILYVFVGLAPLILFTTGFIMWWHRKRKKLGRSLLVKAPLKPRRMS